MEHNDITEQRPSIPNKSKLIFSIFLIILFLEVTYRFVNLSVLTPLIHRQLIIPKKRIFPGWAITFIDYAGIIIILDGIFNTVLLFLKRPHVSTYLKHIKSAVEMICIILVYASLVPLDSILFITVKAIMQPLSYVLYPAVISPSVSPFLFLLTVAKLILFCIAVRMIEPKKTKKKN